MEVKSFAAFVMTYERPRELLSTIEKLLAQTFPPQKILIVDNSTKKDTSFLVADLKDPRVEYHNVGFNSGPAGAAHIGLSLLTSQGYEWIFWGDDDDPPVSPESFRYAFQILKAFKPEEVGVIGGLGGKLNRKTGRTLNFQNSELNGIIEADYIPGNKLMIVNSDVVKKGVLPTSKLFFGFEELDYCLQIKKAGYKILFDGRPILNQRITAGNTDASYRWRGKSIGDDKKLWRQYYSTRNMLYILKKNGLWIALVYNIGRIIIKSFYGFRFGWKYGHPHFKIQWLSLAHFFKGKLGKTELDRFLS
jgi:GT2 family glycosyltransferase